MRLAGGSGWGYGGGFGLGFRRGRLVCMHTPWLRAVMLLLVVSFSLPAEAGVQEGAQGDGDRRESVRRLLERFDGDGDGRFSADERRAFRAALRGDRGGKPMPPEFAWVMPRVPVLGIAGWSGVEGWLDGLPRRCRVKVPPTGLEPVTR